MSIKIMTAVWERAPFTQATLLVLLALADHAADDGTCYPSVPRLALAARTSERHVQRVLRELEQRQWITRRERPNTSTMYRVTIPEGVRPMDTPGGDVEVTPPVTPRSPGGDTQVTRGVTPRSVRGDTQVTQTIKNPQLNRQGTVTRPTAAPTDTSEHPSFPKFWEAYPRHDARRKAAQAYRSALKRTGGDPTPIILGARRYAGDPNRDPGFTAMATTWLNGDRWNDGPMPARGNRRPTTDDKVRDGLALAEQLRQQPTPQTYPQIGA